MKWKIKNLIVLLLLFSFLLAMPGPAKSQEKFNFDTDLYSSIEVANSEMIIIKHLNSEILIPAKCCISNVVLEVDLTNVKNIGGQYVETYHSSYQNSFRPTIKTVLEPVKSQKYIFSVNKDSDIDFRKLLIFQGVGEVVISEYFHIGGNVYKNINKVFLNQPKTRSIENYFPHVVFKGAENTLQKVEVYGEGIKIKDEGIKEVSKPNYLFHERKFKLQPYNNWWEGELFFSHDSKDIITYTFPFCPGIPDSILKTPEGLNSISDSNKKLYTGIGIVAAGSVFFFLFVRRKKNRDENTSE